MNKDTYSSSSAWFSDLMFRIVIGNWKEEFFYIYIIRLCFWKTNNAEIEVKRQVKLFKGFKTFVYTSDVQM